MQSATAYRKYTYTYAIGDYNQVSSISKTDTSNNVIETDTFTYDVNGTLSTDTLISYSVENQNGTDFDVRNTLTKTYDYDYTDMMGSADVDISIDARIKDSGDPYTNASTDSAEDIYVYNGDGQRVKKITDGIEAKYYYSGSVILYTADEDNNPNPYATNYYFYHYDIRGSVTTILKPNATLEQGYTYDEFGNSEAVSQTSLLTNEYSYTGAISDSTTGLTYMNARYYNPATGSFTSQDTYYGEAYSPWTQHLYSYTGGNPVNYIDPTGHFVLTLAAATAAVAYVAIAALVVTAGIVIKKLVNDAHYRSHPATTTAPSSPGTNITTSPTSSGVDVPSVTTSPTTSPYVGENIISTPASSGVDNPNVVSTPLEQPIDPVTYLPTPIYARSILDNIMFADKSKMHTPDQQALVELAKEAAKAGGVSLEDAETLLNWAEEYNLPAHGPEVHINRPGKASNVPHIHIGPVQHLPILP